MQGVPAKSGVSSVLLATAAFVIVAAGLKEAQALVNPFLLAVFIAVISTPPLFWLESHGLGRGAALVIVIVAVIGLLTGLSVLVGASVNDFGQKLPQYGAQLEALFADLLKWLRELNLGFDLPSGDGEGGMMGGLMEHINPAWVLNQVGNLFNGFGAVLANAFLILLTVIFLLLEASHFSDKVYALADDSGRARSSIRAFTDTVRRYLAIKTMMSIGTGVAIGLWLWGIGVEHALLWALLACFLNYVPNVGSIIAAVPTVLFALVQLGVGGAVWTGAGYLVVNVVFGNVLEPRFMGRGLGLSTLVVFLSLVFWGWVLGPVGMFLSVPLTITAKIAFAANDSTRWIAVLLSAEGELPFHDDDDEARAASAD